MFNDSYLCWWWMSLDLKRCVTGKGLPPVKLWHAGVSFTVLKQSKSLQINSLWSASWSYPGPDVHHLLMLSDSQLCLSPFHRFFFFPQNGIKSSQSTGQLLSLQPSRMFTCQQNKSNNACCQMLPWTLCHSNSADCKTAAMCVPFISLMYRLSSFDWNKCITYLEYSDLGTYLAR